MKYLGLLGIFSLLTTLVAAVPLEKRVVVYETVTKQVVVTVNLTTTLTVTGNDPGTANVETSPTPTPTSPASTDGTSYGLPTGDDSSSALEPEGPPPSVQEFTAPVEPIPTPTTSPVIVEDNVVPSPVVTSPSPPTTIVEPTVVEPSPPVEAQSLPSNTTPDSTNGSCDPETSCAGEATVFDVQWQPPQPGAPACGVATDGQNENIVALSAHLMGPLSNGNSADGTLGPAHLLNPFCGRKIQVTYQGKTVTATVKDKCPEHGCPYENIDLSRAAFRELGLEESRYNVEWHFIS